MRIFYRISIGDFYAMPVFGRFFFSTLFWISEYFFIPKTCEMLGSYLLEKSCANGVRPQSYGVFPLCSRTLGSPSIAIYSVPALAPVGMFALKVTECSHCVPAPWAPQVSLFTMFPHPGLPKYRYLQCSSPCPGDPGPVTQDR